MDKIIYHGSDKILKKPYLGGGKLFNDFGTGFYCTENEALAREWAAQQERKDGFVNMYRLRMDELNVLQLRREKDSTLKWLALLIHYRNIRITTPMMKKCQEWLLKKYLISMDSVDVIIGYRADDSYFSFARAFLTNQISFGQLEYAMKLGELGEQIVLKSEEAFRHLEFLDCDSVDSRIFFPRRKRRDDDARDRYWRMLEEEAEDGIFIRDMMKEQSL